MSQVLDHLWQSTLLALGLGILALAFRKAPAGVRHGLWFAASLKFLVPFAALALLGRLIGPAIPLPEQAKPEAAFIAEAAQPFSQPAQSPLSVFPFAHDPQLQAPQQAAVAQPITETYAAAAVIRATPRMDLGLILLAVWGLGSAAMLLLWTRRWTRLRKVMRSASRLDWPAPMPVLAAPALVEPGLVGLWRPVLLVPQSLPEQLTRPEIDALVAHEACHLRRRDNLCAALHMLVEALFWFHPMVWWIGARMIEQRERACDEAVVRAGHDRAAYARSLVEICRFYLRSPLDCVAGASGSDLKTRVEAIMTAPPSSPLSRSKKALLLAAGAFAFATPVMAGLLATPAGQKAVARAAAIASRAAPALIAPAEVQEAKTAPDQSAAVKPVVLAQSQPIVTPGLDIARLDTAAGPLSQDLPALSVASAPYAVSPATVTKAADANSGDVSTFIQSYGEPFWNTDRRLCIRVRGAPGDQASMVQQRVAAVARSVGVSIGRSQCSLRFDIEIRFDTDADRAVREVLNFYRNPVWPLPMDRPQGADRPIRAWYGMVYDFAGGTGGRGLGRNPSARTKFALAIVVVDPQRTQGMNLDLVSDYVAKLGLSQPRALDKCNVLPSITDLFAGACPGRAAPTGLTVADTAFLRALYTGSPGIRATRSPSELANLMTRLMANGGGPAPGAEAAPQAPAAQPAIAPTEAPRLSLTPVAMTSRSAGGKPEVSAFVKSFTNTLWNQDAICIRTEGLPPDKAAYVQARVEADVRAAGLSAQKRTVVPSWSGGPSMMACKLNEVEIRFAADAERAVRDVLAERKESDGRNPQIQRPQGADRPIRAWYTVGDDLTRPNHPVQWAPGAQTGMESQITEAAPDQRQKLGLAIVVVDPARTRDMSLDAVADYVAMLAISQPRALDRCNVLPSVTDLFAGACPGRAAPAGLTAADAAYLKALYAGNAELRATRYTSDIVDGMAKRLDAFRLAAR